MKCRDQELWALVAKRRRSPPRDHNVDRTPHFDSQSRPSTAHCALPSLPSLDLDAWRLSMTLFASVGGEVSRRPGTRKHRAMWQSDLRAAMFYSVASDLLASLTFTQPYKNAALSTSLLRGCKDPVSRNPVVLLRPLTLTVSIIESSAVHLPLMKNFDSESRNASQAAPVAYKSARQA